LLDHRIKVLMNICINNDRSTCSINIILHDNILFLRNSHVNGLHRPVLYEVANAPDPLLLGYSSGTFPHRMYSKREHIYGHVYMCLQATIFISIDGNDHVT